MRPLQSSRVAAAIGGTLRRRPIGRRSGPNVHVGRAFVAAQFETTSELTPVALAAGYAVVYPNGIESRGPLGLQTWNGGACCGRAADTDVDDVAFITQLLDLLERDYPVDPTRIFATGHSNGGMIAYRLACESSDQIAAVAANDTAMVVDDCAPTRPIPVLHLHSVLDENVPVDGGAGVGPETNEYPPLDVTIGSWVAINGCRADPVEVTADQVTHRTWGPGEAMNRQPQSTPTS